MPKQVRLQPGEVVVVAADSETAGRAMEVFTRTASCLELLNNFSRTLLANSRSDDDYEATMRVTLHFVESFTALYPGGEAQCTSDLEILRTVSFDKQMKQMVM